MEISRVLSYGETLGLDELEVFLHQNDMIDVEAELGEISKTTRVAHTNIFVRGVVDTQVGFGFTNDPRFIKDTVKQVYSSAKANIKDKRWHGLPGRGKYHEIEEYDAGIEKMTVEEVIDTCQEIIDRTPEGITPASCSVRREISEKHCVTTNGIDVSERGTWLAGYTHLIAKTKEGVTPGCLGIDITRKKDLNVKEIVEPAARDAQLSTQRKKAESGPSNIILHPYALEDLLGHTLIVSLLGENVVREKSFLAGKKGAQLFSKDLTIEDDPFYPNGMKTMKCDSEGVPTERTPLIEKGVLKQFLWNTYWGKIAGEKSTGNGSRNPTKGTVGISPTNIIIAEGGGGVFDIEEGYYIKGFQGAHSSNPESGEFSVVGNPAFRVENGEVTGGSVLMISGTIYDLLEKIDAVGEEQIRGTGIIAPLIRFSDVRTATK